MSALAIYHMLKSDFFNLKLTSVSELYHLDKKETIHVVFTINLNYPDDLHKKLKFLCMARNRKWNIRIAVIMMSRPVSPVFIDWLLQEPTFDYCYFNSYMEPPLLGDNMIDFFKSSLHPNTKPKKLPKKLTNQECIVLIHLLQGRSPSLISRYLNINPKTVHHYQNQIFDKLFVPSKREFILNRKTILMIIFSISASLVPADLKNLGVILNATLDRTDHTEFDKILYDGVR